MKKVLITGVAGFIGSNLAEYLLGKGFDVVGIDNLSYGTIEQVPRGVVFHHVDIREIGVEKFFHGVDAVFHLAAKNCISDCQENPVETTSINVLGTVNVLRAATKAKIKKFVYAESSAVYEGCDTLPTPESCEAPESFYAVSKISAVNFLNAYKRFYGLEATILRYFCVYGPRQDYRRTIPPVFSSFIIRMLTSRRPIIYGDGSKRRDFIHVDDINEFHLCCLLDRRTDGETYNLGSGINYSVLGIYKKIRDLLGSEFSPEFRNDLSGEAIETLADISKARLLGWSPQVSLEAGLLGSIDYIRKELEDGKVDISI